MTTYAKLREDGSLELFDRIPNVANATATLIRRYALSHGYKVVQYVKSPGEWYSPAYSENGSIIQQNWKEWGVPEKFTAIQTKIQELLDSTAAERNYDNIFTALTYLDSKNAKFKAEAEALKDWRDDVWTKCYAYLAEVEAGKKKIPSTWEDVLLYIPKFEWPEIV